MRIVGIEIITALVAREKGTQRAQALERRMAAWRAEISGARYVKPTDVNAVYGAADVVGNNRIVFNICGNRYRLIVQFNYAAQVARVRFAGTHAEYDRVDATTV